MTISDKIFELINERGMTQKEFAQKTGIVERRDKISGFDRI